jgi:hypothetical protein
MYPARPARAQPRRADRACCLLAIGSFFDEGPAIDEIRSLLTHKSEKRTDTVPPKRLAQCPRLASKEKSGGLYPKNNAPGLASGAG